VEFCFSSSFISSPPTSTDTSIGDASLVIRAVEARDLKSLTEVITHSFHPRRGLLYWFHPLLKLGIYEDLRSRLRSISTHQKCLVASRVIDRVSGQVEEIVGTVEITMRLCPNLDDRYPYISNLAVSNSYRRQGVAKQLLLKCEQIARDWGYQDISLHVLEDNYPARRLYFDSGYRLYSVDFTFGSWFFKHPRRMLLRKQLNRSEI
jgi:ribosomal protein S18 acetylase RimI-like enzyme